MKKICLPALLLLLGMAAAEAGDDRPASARLVGTYTIVAGERDDKALPKEDFAGSIVTITKDKILGTDKDRKEFFACTYTVDTSRKPWGIRMTSTAPKEGEKSQGVVSLDGDTVKICYNLPGGKAPTTFKAGEKQHYFELKRAKR